MAALDELHRHASSCGIVGETHQQLRDAAVGERLRGRGAVALRHSRQTQLGVDTLTKTPGKKHSESFMTVASRAV